MEAILRRTLILILFISILLGQENIIHITKTYPNGTPKEVTVYELNNNLKSDNPFRIAEKIKYDSKGRYIQPIIKLSKQAKNAQRWIIGKWATEEMDSSNLVIQNNRDSSYSVFDNGEIIIQGKIFISEQDGRILLNFNKGSGWSADTIQFIDRNKFQYNGEGIFYRKK